jgi:flagellar assembly factor FliW
VTDEVPVITFATPLPGFPGLGSFLLVDVGAEPSADSSPGPAADPVLYELRSVEQPEIRFLVAVPQAFFPEYAVDLDESACLELDLNDAGDALVLVILTVGVDPAPTTANLMAPVVINARTRAAAQVILSGADWPVRATVA